MTQLPPDDISRIQRTPSSDRDEKQSAALQRRLDVQKAREEHWREKQTLHVITCCIWVLIILVFSVVALSIFALGLHMLFPKYGWLTKDELEAVKNFMLSGAVVGLGTTYMRRYLEQPK